MRALFLLAALALAGLTRGETVPELEKIGKMMTSICRDKDRLREVLERDETGLRSTPHLNSVLSAGAILIDDEACLDIVVEEMYLKAGTDLAVSEDLFRDIRAGRFPLMESVERVLTRKRQTVESQSDANPVIRELVTMIDHILTAIRDVAAKARGMRTPE